jgi:hypothetical protein
MGFSAPTALHLLVAILAAGAGAGITSLLGGGGGATPSVTATDEIPAAMLALYQEAAATCPGLPWTSSYHLTGSFLGPLISDSGLYAVWTRAYSILRRAPRGVTEPSNRQQSSLRGARNRETRSA